MSELPESFKINLNQNLWGLAIGLVALGFGELHRLDGMTIIAAILSIIMGLSVTVTTVVYTVRYCKKKMQ